MKRWAGAALAVFFCSAAFYPALGPLSSFRSEYLYSASVTAAIGLAAALAGSALVLGVALARSGGPWEAWTVPACWLAPLVLSTILGVDPIGGAQICAVAALSATFYLAAIRFASRESVRGAIAAYLAAGALAAAAGIVMNLLHVPHALDVFNHGRAAGVFATANYFGAFLVTLIVTAIGAAVAFGGRLRAVSAVAAAAGAIALALTYSRGAQAGTLAGAALLLWWLGLRRAAAGAAAALALAALFAFAHPDVHHDPSENFSRRAIWATGIRVVELFPFSGAGPMGYHILYPAVEPVIPDPAAALGKVQPHNVVLSLWADLGTAGLAAIAAGWLVFARRLRRELAVCDRPFSVLTLSLCAALAGTLVQGMVDLVGPPELVFVWIPFAGLAAASARAGAG